MKISLRKAVPRDLLVLANSLLKIPQIRADVKTMRAQNLQSIATRLLPIDDVIQRIQECLVEDAPLKLTDGGVFKEGINKELDELLHLKRSSHNWLASYQTKLREEFEIKNLKVNYNRAFGFFIEVSRGQSHKLSTRFDRRQTLVTSERFISPELKEYEEKILGAEEKIGEIEQKLFFELLEEMDLHTEKILIIAKAIAELDTLLSLATVALEKDYYRPIVTNGDEIHIKGGRHPIIESTLESKPFIPNDTHLDNNCSLMLITGPNMAGKSTYIRQVALYSIMAQIGSFIPARSATIGIVDKVFTRIGASDDLSRGQSTFMVEMSETASILHNATKRSLIILDEIGRGTSTYDGIAIAYAVASHILETIGAKTLFATHYFELTSLSKQYPKAVNFRVAAKEDTDSITFLHKIEKGEADKSYGIHVAKLAGLPKEVITIAKKRLSQLQVSPQQKLKAPNSHIAQLSLFPTNEPDYSKIISELERIELENISPLCALNQIARWKDELRT